ncbi:conserved membrane protein of unknown function [Candidatus Hydrogenisulfobacillus filiaventi]|uniref:Uncharacterized protein n=1 Tax=Candidatus Hydrogenisulfobacillus filiaventi TaxID=2707344 RepID=A0A6F8ZEJ6_9FIRM|nr:conserved membrane protein of unknown function [Candidatus Hydrogenisulfobacillus filiaventi]
MPVILGRPYTEQTPPFWLPISFFALGFSGWLAGLAALLGARRTVLAGAYTAPGVLAAVHLLTLGFITAFMSGALYQLAPVLLNRRLARPRLGAVQAGLHSLGVVLLTAGMATARPAWMLTGGSLLTIGLLLLAANLVATARGARQRPVSGAFVSVGLVSLLGAAGMGLAMAARWAAGRPPQPLLPWHLALGLGGWFAAILTGVSYKLLPMFLGGPANPRHSPWVLGGLVLSVGLAMAAPHGGPLAAAAALLAAATAALYLGDVTAAWRARPRKPADAAMVAMGLGSLNLALSLALTAAGLATGGVVPWAGAAFFLYLNGWLGISIQGFLSRILPFLLWLHRYSRRWAEGPLPRLTDLLPDRWVRSYTWTTTGGVWLATAGLLLREAPVLAAGLLLTLAGVAAAAGSALAAVGERAPEMARFRTPSPG